MIMSDSVKRGDKPSRKAGKAIRQLEKSGGIKFECGCFLAAKSTELRIFVANNGAEAVLDLISDLEIWHDCLAKAICE